MRVLIDGDAFPDIEEIINVCKKYQKRVIIYTDTSHVIENDYATVVIVNKGSNAVDLVIENEVKAKDLVLTHDYGVAMIAIYKEAYVLNPYGKFYNYNNINYLMEFKNINRKLRKHTNVKGVKKLSYKDRKRLINSIIDLFGSEDFEKEKF